MSEPDESGWCVLAMMALGFGLGSGCAGGCATGIATMRNQAIDRGYAQHNPKTGDFEWIEPVPAKDAE